MKGLSIKLSENGGAAPEAVPYMPAGVSEISATVNGVPGRRVVVADRVAAERLNADLAEKLQAAAEQRKARPLVMFDHNVQGGAAAVPVGFEWDEERGILLRVEWTQAGREAVEGGNYGYVSPSFRLRPGSSEILGLADGVEVGSLVNDPAFERNECIAAGRVDAGDEVVVVHAANPYGCNQYGHEFKAPHGDGWGGGRQRKDKKETPEDRYEESKKLMRKHHDEFSEAQSKYSEAMKKVYDYEDAIDRAYRAGDKEKVNLLDKEQEKARLEWKNAKKELEKAREAYSEVAKKHRAIRAEARPQDFIHAAHEEVLPPRGIDVDEERSGYNVVTPGGVGLEGNTKRKRDMEEIAKLLGLPADADAATICAKIAALKKEVAVDKKRIEEVEAEKEEHKKALHEHKHAAADAFVKRQTKEGKIAPLDKERLQAARNMYLSDPEGAECIFAGMRRVDNVREAGGEADKVNAAANRNYENLSLAELLAEEDKA